jgi:bcr-type benzoyl-CoA reductase subunit C
MMSIFMDAVSHLKNPSVLSAEEKKRKIVGYTCSFMPGEIFHAAGMLPYRIRGIDTESMEIGDAYYGPYICTFPKCILQLAGEGKFSFLDGLVITPGCDAMRRLDECWRKAGEDYKGIVPGFFYYFDVPHKIENHGMIWFQEEIQRLIINVEAHFNVNIAEDSLKESIRIYNKGRRLLQQLEEMRTVDNPPISGTQAFAAAVAGTVMERREYNRLLENLIDELKGETGAISGKKRLMVVGSVSDDISLVQLIEDCEALVVAENLCFGVRHETDEVSETGDPVKALAERYLADSVCPRMFGKYKRRLSLLKEKIGTAKVDGVILQNIRFCDLHGSENGLFERDLEASGTPCLRLEREYGPLIETGRIKMRIDAFLERIS